MSQKGKGSDDRTLGQKLNDNRVAIMIGLKVGEWLVRLVTDSIADDCEIDADGQDGTDNDDDTDNEDDTDDPKDDGSDDAA